MERSPRGPVRYDVAIPRGIFGPRLLELALKEGQPVAEVDDLLAGVHQLGGDRRSMYQ